MQANMRSTEGLTREDLERNRSIVVKWREWYGYHRGHSPFDNKEDHMDFMEGILDPGIFSMLSGPLPTRGPEGEYVENPRSDTISTKIKPFRTKLTEDLLTGKPSELIHTHSC